MKKKNILLILLIVFLIILDQATKIIVINTIKGESVNIINNFLNFTYVENSGVAFGINSNGRVTNIIINIIVMAVVIRFMLNQKEMMNKFTSISLSLILAGGFGNLIDRIFRGTVIDFIDNFTDIFGITDKDVIGNQAPFDFDVSVKDIYSCLKTGATLVIIPKSYFVFPNSVVDMLDKYNVTTLIWAVSALVLLERMHSFKYKAPKSINKILFIKI